MRLAGAESDRRNGAPEWGVLGVAVFSDVISAYAMRVRLPPERVVDVAA